MIRKDYNKVNSRINTNLKPSKNMKASTVKRPTDRQIMDYEDREDGMRMYEEQLYGSVGKN